MSISTNLDGVTQIGTWNFNLSQVGGSSFVLGPNNKAGSLSVTIATDQGAIPVSISGTVPVSISATVPVTFDTTQPLTLNPVQVVNPNDSDNKVPLVVSLTASDVQNIVNPVTVTGTVTANVGSVTANQGASPWVIQSITNPVTVTGALSFAGTGQLPSAQSTSVVIASDQVVQTTARDPIQVINPTINDQPNPLAVQLVSSDIGNIVNPIAVSNFPASTAVSNFPAVQPVSIPGTVPTTGNLIQISGAAPSAVNPLPVQISDGSMFKDPSTLLASLVQLQAISLQWQNAAGFFPLEVPPFLGA